MRFNFLSVKYVECSYASSLQFVNLSRYQTAHMRRRTYPPDHTESAEGLATMRRSFHAI